jgi:site-specific DNA-methyltransferase (adenine-specific)
MKAEPPTLDSLQRAGSGALPSVVAASWSGRSYYEAEGVTLYCGDMREIVPLLGMRFDAAVTDPPYAETSLAWDVWPHGWPALLAPLTDSLWCFGSLRMFLDRVAEFAEWKLAQDVVWEKHNGSGFDADRFKRVHELAVQFYRGEWKALQRAVPRIPGDPRSTGTRRRTNGADHRGDIGGRDYVYGETRMMRSVIPVRSCNGHAVNETQKPEGIVAPLIEYSVPPGGIVLDCFAGSGTVLVEARRQGKRAVGIEARESQCEEIAKRLSQRELFLGGGGGSSSSKPPREEQRQNARVSDSPEETSN